MHRKRSNFRNKDHAGTHSQIIDFTPPTLLESESGQMPITKVTTEDFAYFDLDDRRDRNNKQVDARDFQLQLNNLANASPISNPEKNAKHKSQ